jgi:hypothetical protein
MKSIKLFIVLAIACTSFTVNAQSKSESVKVFGNCGMCQTRIEKAAKEAGATTAKWDAETNMLAVSYRTSITSLDKIEQKVASVGHDTKGVRANDEAYSKLHGCCQYERVGLMDATAVTCCSDKEKCMFDGKCTMKGTEACKMKAGEECKMVDGKSCCSKA